MKWSHVVKAALIAEKVLTDLDVDIKGIKPKQFEQAVLLALTTGKTIKEILKPNK